MQSLLSSKASATTNNADICKLCGSCEDPDVLLICDGCDVLMHTYCLNLPAVPVGDWYCAACRRNPPKKAADAAGPPLIKSTTKPGTIHSGLKVFFYERVSSEGQEDLEHGRVGMDTQNSTLLKFAHENGLLIRGTGREVHSAWRDPAKRTQLKSICRMIRSGECILVYSVSRFSRNLEHGRQLLELIHQAGGWVYSVTEICSSYDERFLTLLKSAQGESDLLSQKMKDANARIRAQGGHIGPAPFGWTTYRDESSGIRMLTPSSEEQKILVTLRKKYSQLNYRSNPAHDTAFAMNDAGMLYRGGKKWTANLVAKCVGTLDKKFTSDLSAALDTASKSGSAKGKEPK